LFDNLVKINIPESGSPTANEYPLFGDSVQDDSVADIVLPDALIIKQWICQPYPPFAGQDFGGGTNFVTWDLLLNDTSLSQLKYGTGGIAPETSDGNVRDINVTSLKGSRLRVFGQTAGLQVRTGVMTFKFSLTGIWLRD